MQMASQATEVVVSGDLAVVRASYEETITLAEGVDLSEKLTGAGVSVDEAESIALIHSFLKRVA